MYISLCSLFSPLYFQVNGLSNMFWGWGREDDELFQRMKEAGMSVSKPWGLFNWVMRALVRIAKEVKFYLRQPQRGKFKQFNNLKIQLHFRGFFCLSQNSKRKNYKHKQIKRKTVKNAQRKKKKITSMWLLCALFDLIKLLVV